MFLAVSIFVGQGMLSGAVARTGDVRAVRRTLAAEDRFAPIGGAMFLLGVVFGFLTAITSDFDLTETWLLIGYALALFVFVIGTAEVHRHQSRRSSRAGESAARWRSWARIAGSPTSWPRSGRCRESAPSSVVMKVIAGRRLARDHWT